MLPVFETWSTNRETHRLDLSRAEAPDASVLAHWKTGDERALRTHLIAIVQVIDGNFAVVEKSLFDVAQPERLDVKIVVFLRSADARA